MTDHEETAKRLTRKWNGNGYDLLEQMIAAALAQAEAGNKPHADEDGSCSRCGLVWQEEGITEPHTCPPGFWTDEEVEIARLKAENLRLSHEGLLVEKQAAEAERDYFRDRLAEAQAGKEKDPA